MTARAHDVLHEEREIRDAWREVRAVDRAYGRRGSDGERGSTVARLRSARLRLIPALLLSMLPPGPEAHGLALRLDRFLQDVKLAPGTLDALIRHLNRDHPTLRGDKPCP